MEVSGPTNACSFSCVAILCSTCRMKSRSTLCFFHDVVAFGVNVEHVGVALP